MSASLEKAIQDEVRDLTDDQQREVIAFVESLKPKPSGKDEKRYSFVGIAHSGNGSLSINETSILEQAVDRYEGWSLH